MSRNRDVSVATQFLSNSEIEPIEALPRSQVWRFALQQEEEGTV